MKKYTKTGLVVLAGVLAGNVQAEQLYSENFDRYDYYTELNSIEGWTVATGLPIITDGQLNYSNSKSAWLLGGTYSFEAETSADHQIDALWIRFRARFTGDADGAVFRLGVGNSRTGGVANYGRYAGVHVKAKAGESNLVEFKAVSQNGTSPNVTPVHGDFVDIYCKLTNDSLGNLSVSVWYNPETPNQLGAPACSKSVAYNPAYGGKIFDSIQLNAWSSSVAHLIDDIEVGTRLADVAPPVDR